ncbi:MAG: ribonuclease P protein component [Coxiella endosymbiont of Haemaphysalis qinghaiensis]
MNYNFSMHWRIHTTTEFYRVYSRGWRLSGHYYLLYYRNNSFDYPRLGVVASRKSLKKAIIRNRARRIVKENFRLKKDLLYSMDIIFIAKSQSRGASKKELNECISQLLNQLIMQSEGSSSE